MPRACSISAAVRPPSPRNDDRLHAGKTCSLHDLYQDEIARKNCDAPPAPLSLEPGN
jgi:hypothetical protein